MLAAWVGVVLSSLAFSLAAEPTRCCFDNQYSAKLGIVGQVLTQEPFFLDGGTYVGVDLYTDRQATYSIFRNADGTNSSRYELRDYAMKRVYTRENGTCTYRDLQPFEVSTVPRCIPDDAIFLGPSVLGYGHHSMKLYTWSLNYQMDPTQSSQVIISVTQDHCVPVMESVIGVIQGIPVEESIFLTDYHPGIERLEYLQIPQNCQPAPVSKDG